MLFLGQLVVVLCVACTIARTGAGYVGVNYGILANNLPPPAQTAQLLLTTSLRNVKIYNPDQATLEAFANTNINVVVGVPNEDIPALAGSATAAQSWVESNIAAYMPATSITVIAVGNEVLTLATNVSPQLAPAMVNVHTALVNLKLDGQVKVSAPQSLTILSKSYPPSAGIFASNVTDTLTPVLTFLSQTSSPLMINAYPYFAYASDANNVSLNYVLFESDAGVGDLNTGLHYTNMLDAQVDAVYSALERVGHKEISVVVSETGWPSSGDATEVGCSISNAQLYNGNLIKHIASNAGTPLRPNSSLDVYIFALFNEDLKPGPSSERNFGLFNPDESVVYNVGLVQTSGSPPSSPSPPESGSPPPSPTPVAPSPESPTPVPASSPPPPVSETPTYSPPPPPTQVFSPPPPPPSPEVVYPPPPPFTPSPTESPSPPSVTTPTSPSPPAPVQSSPSGKTWCVAKAGASTDQVSNALNFACGQGGADCSPIQTGQTCYSPNTLYSHASYAFNSYYQKMGRNYWNCFFSGTGIVTITDPSYSGCTFP